MIPLSALADLPSLGAAAASARLAGFTPPLAGFWFREAASTGASDVDFLYFTILWICVFFFVLIIGMMVAFVARYYARPGHNAEHTASHNNALEATWSILPGFIVLYIFGAGLVGFLDLRTPPEDAYEVQVTAKKWAWLFTYPNGYSDSNLHVPVDRPVKLVMTSEDVIHSLYVPAFRIKCDCVPGRYSTVWFQATRVNDREDPSTEDRFTGEDEEGYDLFCTEYCGQGHSAMLAKVIVHESGTFEPWLEKAMVWPEDESPVARGEQLYKKRGCAQCHSLDGTPGTGPSYKGTFGTTQQTNQGPVTIDENYIRESILNPMAKIRTGYAGVMPSFQGQLKENELAALVWFIKAQSGDSKIVIPKTWAEAGGVPGQEPQDAAAADGSNPAGGQADGAQTDGAQSDAAKGKDAEPADSQPASEKSEDPKA